MDFEKFWAKAIKFLKSNIAATPGGDKYMVNSWRADNKISELKFPVVDANPRHIRCLSIHASKDITIPKNDMGVLYDMWNGYVGGKISRMEIIEKIRRPTYCVSLMKHLKDEIR